ncbi:MAG: hypothetical protein MK212_15340 [Saprospiraceae bacterium]|nr:hypothetical protein [Saprospiraceae bacterium]
MHSKLKRAAAKANFLRYRKAHNRGHYESYFIRANHPNKATAFWIRYTLFVPRQKTQNAIAELWAVYFENGTITPVKQEYNLSDCVLNTSNFNIKIGASHLRAFEAKGSIEQFSWDLTYENLHPPIFLLPLAMYDLPFPKAKSIISQPFASFGGHLKIGDQTVVIDNWLGSQNHNWGTEHTNRYAWGQVVGFEQDNRCLLELITASVNIAKWSSPFITLIVLYYNDKIQYFHQFKNWIQNKGKYAYFTWTFEAKNSNLEIKGTIQAEQTDFVGLRYYNTDGTDKFCLNSKVASCTLNIRELKTGKTRTLSTVNRCAFEILTDEEIAHGVPIHF